MIRKCELFHTNALRFRESWFKISIISTNLCRSKNTELKRIYIFLSLYIETAGVTILKVPLDKAYLCIAQLICNTLFNNWEKCIKYLIMMLNLLIRTVFSWYVLKMGYKLNTSENLWFPENQDFSLVSLFLFLSYMWILSYIEKSKIL